MTDPTMLMEPVVDEVDEYEAGAETCASCRYFEGYAVDDEGWGTCDRPKHPGALFECSDGGFLDVAAGFSCSQHEPAEEDGAYVTVPADPVLS